jgi:hypothetical protein
MKGGDTRGHPPEEWTLAVKIIAAVCGVSVFRLTIEKKLRAEVDGKFPIDPGLLCYRPNFVQLPGRTACHGKEGRC